MIEAYEARIAALPSTVSSPPEAAKKMRSAISRAGCLVRKSGGIVLSAWSRATRMDERIG